MAESKGFEPSIPVTVYTLSKRAPSTTRPNSPADEYRIICSSVQIVKYALFFAYAWR